MSAFGTEKFPTTSLRLGMPSAYQNAYSKLGDRPRFAPDAPIPAVPIMVGQDFQSEWHAQKMADAHRMVRAKVQSTVNMYNRANSSANNSPGHQQPVLGQRIFANPSMTAGQSGNSTRQDYAAAPWHFSDAHGLAGGSHCMDGGSNGRLVGGVLRSAQGQSYGMSLLQKRLADFEKISQMAEEFQNPAMPMREEQGVSAFAGEQPSASQSLATLQNVELSQLLQNVLDSIQEGESDDSGVTRMTYTDSTRAFALIVRLATAGGAEDLADVLEYLDGTAAEDGIIPKLRSLTQRPITDASQKNQEIFVSLLEFWERVKSYLTKMVATVGMPLKNRAAASQAYIKSLGFTKLFKGRLPEEFVERQDAQQAVDVRRGYHFPGAGPGAPDGDDANDGAPPGGGLGGRRTVRREDSQHGYTGRNGAQFSRDDRQRFGYASGEYNTGGRPVAWAGEEGEYGAAPLFGSPEEQEGDAEYSASALGTNPGNAGPRLRSFLSPQTGEYDVSPPPDVRRLLRPSPLARAAAAASPSPRPPAAAAAAAAAPPRRAASSAATLEEGEEEAPVGYEEAEARDAARGVATPASPTGHLPPFLRSRDQLPSDIKGLIALAGRVNTFYKNNLPDGKGKITVGPESKVRNVKLNFTRRLNLPSRY